MKAARTRTKPAIVQSVERLHATTAVKKDMCPVNAQHLRKKNHATAVGKPAIFLVTVVMQLAVEAWAVEEAIVVVEAEAKNATSVERLGTSLATVWSPEAEEATEEAIAPVDTAAAMVVVRRTPATLVEDTDICRGTALKARSVTTVRCSPSPPGEFPVLIPCRRRGGPSEPRLPFRDDIGTRMLQVQAARTRPGGMSCIVIRHDTCFNFATIHGFYLGYCSSPHLSTSMAYHACIGTTGTLNASQFE